MYIRKAELIDVEQIEKLIQPYIDDFAVDEDGAEKFSALMIGKLIQSQGVNYYLAEECNYCVGVMAYREPAHLVHFFVRENKQGIGIGRELWLFVNEKIKKNEIEKWTVNSSLAAEKIYQRFGFDTVSDVIEAHGLRFIQMEKFINKN